MSYQWRERILTGRSRSDRSSWLFGLLLVLLLALLWLVLDGHSVLIQPNRSPWWSQLPFAATLEKLLAW